MNDSIEKAVILAAGRGTRMGNLTSEIPKPMLEVRGRPILQHILSGLTANGIREFLIIVGFRRDVITDHFQDGSKFGVVIDYKEQVVQDGTGKVVELAKDFAGDDSFVLSYGDILVPPEAYAPLVDPGVAEAILTVKFNEEEICKGGSVFIDEDNRVTGLIEKPGPSDPKSPWYNAGIYAFAPCIFDYTSRLELSPRGEYELTDAISAMVEDGRVVRAAKLEGDWADVRDPDVLAELNR